MRTVHGNVKRRIASSSQLGGGQGRPVGSWCSGASLGETATDGDPRAAMQSGIDLINDGEPR
ncbi:MAG TPA: hypothetical protein DEP84_07925 [Chloroflexi bacterium]|nr:hypothetical protein [Chloroflexota bacterium]